MNALSYIDLYCERPAYRFGNEPTNALSNISFLIAAIAAVMRGVIGVSQR